MSSVFVKYKEKLAELEVLKKQVNEELKKAVAECKPLDGVKPLGTTMATVKFSTIVSQGHNLSPETYLNDVQIKAAMGFIFPETTKQAGLIIFPVEGLAQRIEVLIKQGYVKKGSSKIYLNTNMIEKLKEIRSGLI